MRQAVAGPKHERTQVIWADGFGSREKLNNQSFTSLVRLHETSRDALFSCTRCAQMTSALRVPLACRRAGRQQIKPANHFLFRGFSHPKNGSPLTSFEPRRPAFERHYWNHIIQHPTASDAQNDGDDGRVALDLLNPRDTALRLLLNLRQNHTYGFVEPVGHQRG